MYYRVRRGEGGEKEGGRREGGREGGRDGKKGSDDGVQGTAIDLAGAISGWPLRCHSSSVDRLRTP